MNYSKVQETIMRKALRDAMAIEPLISIRSLQVVLEKKLNRQLSKEYIQKLQRKIRGEVKIRPDQESIEKRLSVVRERNRIVIQELFKIAFPMTSEQDIKVAERRKALDTIWKIERDMVKLEMDLGIFTRKLGEVDINVRNKPLAEETRESMLKSWFNWYETPREMRKIEAKDVIIIKPTNPSNEHNNEPKTANSGEYGPRKTLPTVTDAGTVALE